MKGQCRFHSHCDVGVGSAHRTRPDVTVDPGRPCVVEFAIDERVEHAAVADVRDHGHVARNPLPPAILPDFPTFERRAKGRVFVLSGGNTVRTGPGSCGVSGLSTSSDAFECFVLPEIELLLRVAGSLTRNPADAEDLVQDTLLRAFRSIDSFDGRYPRSWLLTILRNTHINRNRRRRPELLREPQAQAQVAAPASVAPDAGVEAMFDVEIDRALRSLSEPFRRVIELVDINGLTYAEAAEVLGVPVGTVMSRLHRARTRIRQRLDRTGLAPKSRS